MGTLENKLKGENVQVLVMIITDGAENASREWTKAKVKELVARLETERGWKFIFSAANQDAFAEGSKYGFSRTQDFDQTRAGYEKMFSASARMVSNFMHSGVLDDL